ncbi:hypothetical protein SUGI_0040510 [Cryptomeria japonica]|nr:hypothetical protein SUGI_0040510 [Cryptomeria japonica]
MASSRSKIFGFKKYPRPNQSQMPSQLKSLHINGCPKLKEVTLGHLSCLENITIMHCSDLKGVLGISNLVKLVELSIIGCRKLEFERLCLRGMKCLQNITFDVKKLPVLGCSLERIVIDGCREFECLQLDGCHNFKSLTLPTPFINLSIRSCGDLQRGAGISDLTGLIELYISDCPELPSLSSLICLEKFQIDNCKKLQNITLPTLISLDLQGVEGSGDLSNLIEMHIIKCLKLENLPSFFNLNCLEKIELGNFNNLQRVTLPTTLISLSLRSCRDLQGVEGASDLSKLIELYIIQCPKIEEFPKFSNLNCLEKIELDNCNNLQNITLPTTLISLCIRSWRDL